MFKSKEIIELKRNSKKGFSLMELIIVIVIIGILIAAVVGLSGQKETAKASAAEQVVIQISNSAQSWAIQRAVDNFTTVSLPNLQAANVLPAGFDVQKANPWAGQITVQLAPAGTTNQINHFEISMTNVPTEVCTALIQKFSNKTFATPTCTNGGTQFNAVF